jgi:hypothetical protein
MNQTTDDHEQDTVCLVIMNGVSSLVRFIQCKSISNVLPHVLETITVWGATPKDIKCDNDREFIQENKFKVWRQDNQVSLVRVQVHCQRMEGKIENFIRYLKRKNPSSQICEKYTGSFLVKLD